MTGRNTFIFKGLTGGLAEEKSQNADDRTAAHAQIFCSYERLGGLFTVYKKGGL
jgi:hypothetical protein